MNSNVAITTGVIGLYEIERGKADTGTLCGCQGTVTNGSRGTVGKESIQDNSPGRSIGLVAKGGHCKNIIFFSGFGNTFL